MPSKTGRRDLEAERLGGDAEVGFEHLTDVHTARHAERIEHDVDRRSVAEERHVFLRHDAGDDALVPVAARHLVADAKLALRGDETFTCLMMPGSTSSPLSTLSIERSCSSSSSANLCSNWPMISRILLRIGEGSMST